MQSVSNFSPCVIDASNTYNPFSAIKNAGRWCVNVLDKHTDLISSVGILAITTCLLAAKIFKSIPPFLPRIAQLVFDFGGIIWINVQVRDILKSCRDFGRAFRGRDGLHTIVTAAKVFLKTANIFLTCTIFTASVASTFAFPHLRLLTIIAMRPLSLTTLFMGIASDIYDYAANKKLLEKIAVLETQPYFARTMEKTAVCFLEIIANKVSPLSKERWPEAYHLADRLACQIDTFTLSTIEQSLVTKKVPADKVQKEAHRLFFALEDSLHFKQSSTKGNLSLTTLGYISMGLCRAFPGTLIDSCSRWMMSVLYTDELIRSKFFQADLAAKIVQV